MTQRAGAAPVSYSVTVYDYIRGLDAGDQDTDLDLVYAGPGDSSVLVHLNTRLEPVAIPDGLAAFGLARIHPTWPNPTRETSSIVFTLPAATEARLTVYYIRGRKLRTLIHLRHPEGTHRMEWPGRDAEGRILPAGVYLARLGTADGSENTVKVVLTE